MRTGGITVSRPLGGDTLENGVHTLRHGPWSGVVLVVSGRPLAWKVWHDTGALGLPVPGTRRAGIRGAQP